MPQSVRAGPALEAMGPKLSRAGEHGGGRGYDGPSGDDGDAVRPRRPGERDSRSA